MIQPQRLGRFLHTDGLGYILPDVAWNLMGKRWEPLVEFVAHLLMSTGTVSSVYIRGSVPRGLAIEGASDLDVIYISESEIPEMEKKIKKRVAESFPFVTMVELSRLEQETLNLILPPRKTPYFHMLLKTQGLLVAGRDVTRNIAPFKLGPEIASHAFGLRRQYREMLRQLEEGTIEGEETEVRKWFSRRLARAGLEITMNRKLRYTRDIYLCYEQFSEFYPAYQERMYSVLLNCLNGHEELEGYQDLVELVHAEAAGLLSPPTS